MIVTVRRMQYKEISVPDDTDWRAFDFAKITWPGVDDEADFEVLAEDGELLFVLD